MRHVRVVPISVLALVIGGCTDDDTGSSDDVPVDERPAATVTIPPARLTPFCQRMIDLDVALAELPQSEPVGDVIVAAYREALPVVPDEIAVEFGAVLRELETGVPATLPPGSVVLPPITVPPTLTLAPVDPSSPTVPSTSGPPADAAAGTDSPTSTFAPPAQGETFLEEGYLPDETPAQRVNAYIDFTCRNSQNNPGPPATPPSGLPVETDPDDG